MSLRFHLLLPSCLVLSLLFLCFPLSSFSVFLLCLSLSLSPCDVVCCWCVVSCMSLWSWCVRAVWCGTLKNPVCTFKTSPCVPAPRPNVVLHTKRGVGRGGGGWREDQRDTPTPTPNTHTHTNTDANTHTLHTNNTRNAQRTNEQHTTRKVSSPVLLTKSSHLVPETFTNETVGSYTFSVFPIHPIIRFT